MKATFVLAALAGAALASPQYVTQISDNQPQAPAPVPYTPYVSPSASPAPVYSPTSKKSACTPKKSPSYYSPAPVVTPSYTYTGAAKTTPAPYVTPASSTAGAILTQISDNQPQAPSAAPAPSFATSSKAPAYVTPTSTRATYQSGNAAAHNVAGYGAGAVAIVAGILMA